MPPLSPSAKREIGYGPTTRSFLVKNLIFASTRQLRPPWLLRLNRTGFWPISTRTTRRDRCRKKGVRIRQLLVCAALGQDWWARRRSVLSVSDPRERAAREPAGADRAPSSPS